MGASNSSDQTDPERIVVHNAGWIYTIFPLPVNLDENRDHQPKQGQAGAEPDRAPRQGASEISAFTPHEQKESESASPEKSACVKNRQLSEQIKDNRADPD